MRILLAALCFGYAFSAAASSPGMVEGPAGCSWDATVGSAGISSATDETFFFVWLEKEHGRCMEYVPPEICGTAGQQFRVAVPGYAPKKFRQGETVRVWVNGKQASLQQPACTTSPAGR